jgi:hypothetical protein
LPTPFKPLVEVQVRALGVTGLSVVVVDHPLTGETPAGVTRRVHQAMEQLTSLLGTA